MVADARPASKTPAHNFVHLHVHTHYSMLDGACKVGPLVARAKELGMPALAITDHGVMYGAVEFYNECKKAGIKPIIGVEAYMAPGDRRERSTPGGNSGEAAYHLLLLAQDIEGYKNLLRLSKISFHEGFYYKPRIDKETLKAHSKGIICTSSCLGGEVANTLLKKDAKLSRKAAESYLEIFGPDRFFIEVQKHIKEQDQVNPELAELANKLGVGLVGTNDVHFLKKDDYHAHNCLCCISTGKLADDPNRMIYPTELYLKSPDEMKQALSGFDGAMENTLRIAEMCNLELDFGKRYAPVYKVPPEKLRELRGTGVSPASATTSPSHGRDGHATKDDERYLRQLCEDGLVWRYGTTDVPKETRDRLDYELSIICAKGFASYFLIVWDFCNHARDHAIPVGARGSGVGTMVGYLLGLCNVDPLKYGLLFERFMDPSRNEMPDIDIDICQDGRQGVIEYVRKKYGHVAQIITFGTLAAKAACKDVARVMGIDIATSTKLTALIPGVPGMTIDKALKDVSELREMVAADPKLTALIETARKLEGLCRNAGVHAAGVIIADQPLDDIIPLCKDKEGNILTQFEGPIAEKCGMLKMDFLGLRTLSVITRAVDLAKANGRLAKDFDIEKVDTSDAKVLGLFTRGETKGVFQFESGGMQDLLMKMAPDRLEDLIAANALYRPGPMELIPAYCNRKHGREDVPKVHPVMDAILSETYGIMVYQEQVMQIFNQLGGIDLANAYKLIKAISKKTTDVIAKFKPEFIKGTMDKGVKQDKAQEIFDHILKFGGYGFNKSHSTRYAFVAFQTGYLKTYHPVEYQAALLTYEMGDTTKMIDYMDEARRMKIRVLPPDINQSGADFTPVYESVKGKGKAKEGFIRFGMAAVRGVGEKAVETIVAERDKNGSFTSLYDFCERIDTRAVQKSTADALVRCGAFDSVHDARAAMLQVLDPAFEAAQRAQQDKASGQISMFGAAAATSEASPRGRVALPKVPDFSRPELLAMEKELLGIYVSSHPLTERQADVEAFGQNTTKQIMNLGEGTPIKLAAMISAVRARVGKTGRSEGKKWAIVEFEDLEGKIEGMVFSELYEQLTNKDASLIKTDRVVIVDASVDRKRETPSLIVRDIMPIEEAAAKLTTGVLMRLDTAAHGEAAMDALLAMLTKYKGGIEAWMQVTCENGRKAAIQPGRGVRVRPAPEFIREYESTFGPGTIELLGPGSARRKRAEQQRLFAERQQQQETPPATDALMELEEVEV